MRDVERVNDSTQEAEKSTALDVIGTLFGELYK